MYFFFLWFCCLYFHSLYLFSVYVLDSQTLMCLLVMIFVDDEVIHYWCVHCLFICFVN